MKKHVIFLFSVLICIASCKKFDDSAIWLELQEHERRIEELETLCNKMNSNIESLSVIINTLQKNDYVTNVTNVIENGKEIGYMISFNKNASIIIYHGINGNNPEIGVKKDVDGVYYWTLNGEWLLDDEGNKMETVNGGGGITPNLKIEGEYWYISYDDGLTWEKLYKAAGEEGQSGYSMFENVDVSNQEYVLMTLTDGTEIKIPTWKAFETLQTSVNMLNTNLSALQSIVEALQNNDYVSSVAPLTENGKVIGYTIYFTKSNPVVIYHGNDGIDGNDGHTPVIGINKDEDGIYYWTIDGEWLRDAEGNRVPATGNDGITPQTKIEDGYWYVSYNNGSTWNQLDKAVGEDGEDGEDGKDGDAFFSNIDMSDQKYMVLTLINGTTITIPTVKLYEEDLLEIIKKLEAELEFVKAKMEENIEILMNYISELRNNNENIIENIEQLNDIISNLYYSIQYNNENYEAQFEKILERLEYNEQHISELINNVENNEDSIHAVIAILEINKNETEAEIEAIYDEILNTKTTITNVVLLINDLSKELDAIETENTEKITEFKNNIEKLEAIVEELTAKNQIMIEQIQRLEAEIEYLNAKIAELEQMLEDMHAN